MEFNAQEKLVEVREQLERQKAESKENKELFCSALSSFIKRLREDKKNCDKVLVSITLHNEIQNSDMKYIALYRPISELPKTT